MKVDVLRKSERVHLERLKLAAEVLLAEPSGINDVLEAELILFKEGVEHALLLPDRPAPELAGR